MRISVWIGGALLLVSWLAGASGAGGEPASLAQNNQRLFEQLQSVHNFSEAQISRVKAIFAASGYIGQGNPAVTKHPATPEQCRERLQKSGVNYENPAFEKICGAKYMAPLYNPETQRPEDAAACIDQFEFPDIPCDYPVVWVRARAAAEICQAVGKRICDAHEWEGACAGALLPPDYRFGLGINGMRSANNHAYAATKSWSYGPAYRKGICGAASHKNADCNGGDWKRCGSNTYPAGFFPDCHSSLGVYDINGNAAEHMNLPLKESEMASRGSQSLGSTEMKGSWFIFDQYHAHEDWCRWRAPFWHGSRVMDPKSHENYHLGFRCCKTIEPKK